MRAEKNSLYQQLPQVGEFLASAAGQELLRRHPRPIVLEAVREAIAELRNEIARGSVTESVLAMEIEGLPRRVAAGLGVREHRALQPVINATGVILQTNLGRAPLSDAAIESVAAVARGYCNLEFDLDSGKRGHRGARVEELLVQIAECDAAESAGLVVNNCAAATFLALNSLAEGGEVIVSRGELVEIGGGFRVPDILRKSGARLVEVGTTNRTRIQDYADAVTPETRLILRVHRSNFEITGFTEQAELRELVQLGADAGVPVMVDQGTGCILPLHEYGLGRQSSFLEAVKSGAALVCASGDKLLGGPQAGVVVGQQSVIRKLRRNPLYRAFRVDKLTIAALEATLLAYLSGQPDSVPVARMLRMPAEMIRSRCGQWAAALSTASVRATVVPTDSVVGGGTTPGATMASFAVMLQSPQMSAEALAAQLRHLQPPVIGRIHEDAVLLDLRTVDPAADDALVVMLRATLDGAVE
ncbi:L-seryl-tRNA(Sec) selenium transferase [Occallatibacter riparius]|uniref:L-seryl-tRNA(Sec) selenium transferase n=1 Tax=Occallatibacter riparius TaxID=1002689 RepID=A0A9J7BRR0_9BACT|nr:L-seryl-tRNA(Sec) selenium transferase [Occallatibacter riparius]UWZ83733.1 L-seryl-tRNA(Sec) selenium transferase [Occallatibacter riparius]